MPQVDLVPGDDRDRGPKEHHTMATSEPNLVEPVTVSGWYLTVDGRYRHAQWSAGRFRLGPAVERPPTPEEIAASDAAELARHREADSGPRPADAFPSCVPSRRR